MSQGAFQGTPLSLDLTFVNETGRQTRSKESRETVRGHVTRRVFRDKRYRLARTDIGDANLKERQGCESGIGHVESSAHAESVTSRKKGEFKTTKSRAFKPVTTEEPPRVSGLQPQKTLLERLVAYHGPPVPEEDGVQGCHSINQMWFIFLDQDPALCEATLAYATTALSRKNRDSDVLPAARCKVQVIQMINARLSDETRATEVSTMIAVAIMANVERLAGNFAVWEMHLAGLYQIVDLRERIYGHDQHEWICKSLSWAFLSSALLSSPDAIPKSRNIEDGTEVYFKYVPMSNKMNDSMLLLALKHGGYNDLVSIVTEVCEITSTRSETVIDSIPIETTNSYLERLALFQTLPRPQIIAEQLVDSFCTGLVIYILTTFTSTQTIPRLACLAIELQYTLQMRDVRFCSGIELLLWQLFLGAVAAKTGGFPKLRTYFVAKVWVVSNQLAIKEWREAEAVLDSISWLKDSLRCDCREVWQEAWYQETLKEPRAESMSFSLCS